LLDSRGFAAGTGIALYVLSDFPYPMAGGELNRNTDKGVVLALGWAMSFF